MIQPNLFSAKLLALAITIGISSEGLAESWPQWMGQNREGVYGETDVIQTIPKSGLPIKWQADVGSGYGGPSAAGGKVFLMDYQGKPGYVNSPGSRSDRQGQERITAFNALTGEIVWQHAYDRTYSISYASGPRCTPTVDGDLVFCLGAEGDLTCLNTESGTPIWHQNLSEQYGVETPIWGFAAHPLVDGNLLYVMVGGKGQGLVALEKTTGKVVWKALDARTGYCPPSIIESGGARQLIVYHPEGVASLDPAKGSVYWQISTSPSYDMSIARPMVDGNLMYVSGHSEQPLMIELDPLKPAAKVLWRGERKKSAISSGTSTPLFVDGILYGSDQDKGALIAADGKTGDRLWETFRATVADASRFVKHGTCFVTRVRDTDRYFIFSEEGDLILAEMTAQTYNELGRFHVVDPTEEAFGRKVVWSHPAYAHQTSFVRNDRELVAVDISAK